jgi:hypothetical protein
VSRQKTAPAATDLPGVGTLIQVFAEGFDGELPEGLPSRIEDVIPRTSADEPHQLLIAAPYYRGDVELPEEGTPFAVTWPTAREMLELPTIRAGLERTSVLRLWRMAVSGPAVRVQRRNYGRVPTTMSVGITPLDLASEDRAETRHGLTQDVSEGGISCTLTKPQIAPGTPVLVELTVEGAHLDIPGQILRSTPATDAAGTPCVDTAIRFDDPDEYGDVVRRVVFAEQLRARRSGVL